MPSTQRPSHKLYLVTRALVSLYRILFGWLTHDRCRFYPSCSQYAVDSFEVMSPARALCASIRRVLRCHPWNDGGFDPAVKEGAK